MWASTKMNKNFLWRRGHGGVSSISVYILSPVYRWIGGVEGGLEGFSRPCWAWGIGTLAGQDCVLTSYQQVTAKIKAKIGLPSTPQSSRQTMLDLLTDWGRSHFPFSLTFFITLPLSFCAKCPFMKHTSAALFLCRPSIPSHSYTPALLILVLSVCSSGMSDYIFNWLYYEHSYFLSLLSVCCSQFSHVYFLFFSLLSFVSLCFLFVLLPVCYFSPLYCLKQLPANYKHVSLVVTWNTCYDCF